jgi:hypothetical protein
MSDERVQAAVAQAAAQAYEAWAAGHPTLAAVIDRMELTQQTSESLRQSPEYKQAVLDFGKAQSELTLVSQLVELAGPILRNILGM